MRNILLTIVAIAFTFFVDNLHAASLGDKCKTGNGVPPKHLCQFGQICLQAIGNKYCSQAGKICGWPNKSGYNLGKNKKYKGKWYECKASGFKNVSNGSSGGGSSNQSDNLSSSSSSKNCSPGPVAVSKTPAPPAPFVPIPYPNLKPCK